jgi:LPXTG-motif cell wall-anchored protein
MARVTERQVTKADIEAKLREIGGEVDDTAEAAWPYLLIAGVVGAVVLLGAAYLLGRRKGRKRTTVVEIRRV